MLFGLLFLLAVFFVLIFTYVVVRGTMDWKRAVKNKYVVFIGIFIAVAAVATNLYVGFESRTMKTKIWEYLRQEGYRETDIQSVKVKHSFANKILSYGEWKIAVVYADEPESTYTYTLRDGKIREGGVSTTLEKEALKHK